MNAAYKVVIYGPPKIGKTEWASKLPEPLFIDMKASGGPKSWFALMETVRAVRNAPDICKTLVLDAAGDAEKLCETHICKEHGMNDMGSFAYGKGYVYVRQEFGRLVNLLGEVVARGIHVVIIAPARMRKYALPDDEGGGECEHWEMNLSKFVRPLLSEWCDLLLFVNWKLFVTTDKKSKKRVTQGFERTMYTNNQPGWDAKNPFDLPSEMFFSAVPRQLL